MCLLKHFVWQCKSNSINYLPPDVVNFRTGTVLTDFAQNRIFFLLNVWGIARIVIINPPSSTVWIIYYLNYDEMYCMTFVFWLAFLSATEPSILNKVFYAILECFVCIYGTSRGRWSEPMLISLLTDMSDSPAPFKTIPQGSSLSLLP